MVRLRPRTSTEWNFAVGALLGLPPSILYFLIDLDQSGLGLQYYDFFPVAATFIAWGFGSFFWSFFVEKGEIEYVRGAFIGFVTAVLTHIGVVVVALPTVWGAIAVAFVSFMLAPYSVPAYAIYGMILIWVRKRYA